MTYTVTINIAGTGTPLATGGESQVGHMWYSLTDSNGNTASYGFSPVEGASGIERAFGPGTVNAHGQDDTLYQGPRDYTKTIEITQAQYEAMKNFGDNPAANGFSTDYNGLTNSCIDFTWKAMEIGGLNPVGFEGELLPTWNGIDIDIVNALQNLEKTFLQFAFGLGNAINGFEQTIADLFTAAQKFHIVSDPLTLDLDGGGLETTGINPNAPILFDHNADGIKTGTGWIAPDDGMLVLDRNGNGSIDTGRELFGDSTVKSNGQLALDGFDALADLDSNADGKISSADAQFAALRVWRDLNQDGISQGGEIFTLDSLNIASISTAKTANSQTLPNENQIAGLGTYTRTDGSTDTSGDIHLAADTFHREFTSTLDTTAVAVLPDMQGSGVLRDLRQAASQSATLQNLLTQYSAASTREAQLALLDQLLDAWADGGALKAANDGEWKVVA